MRAMSESKGKAAAVCLLLLAAVLLAVLTHASWRHRFEAVPDAPRLVSLAGAFSGEGVRWQRADLMAEDAATGGLVVHAAAAGTPVPEVRIPVPDVPEASHLWFRVATQGKDVVRGEEKWQSPRVVAMWHDGDGRPLPGVVGFAGLRKGANPERVSNGVMRWQRDRGTMHVHIQNLAAEGSMIVTGLETLAVAQRPWVPAAGVLLAGLWGAWMLLLIRLLVAQAVWPRAALAAVMLLALSFKGVFPGPWHPYAPLPGGFATGEEVEPSAVFPPPHGPAVHVPGDEDGRVGVADLPDEKPLRGLLAEALYQLRPISPLFHVVLCFGLALAFIAVLGSRRAAWLVLGLGGAAEASQTLFGFGFDAKDVLDLVVNALGVGLALWTLARYPALARRLGVEAAVS